MDLQHQLSQLADDYRAWLANRPYRSCQTPPALKQRILALSPHFPRHDFAKRIGINLSTLSFWQQSQQGRPFVDDESEDFVLIDEVSERPAITPVNFPTSQLTLISANGVSLSWTGEISPEQLAVLVEVLR